MGGRRAEAWGWTAEGDYREIKRGMWDLIHCYTAVLWVSTQREKTSIPPSPHYTVSGPGATGTILLPSGLNQTLNSPTTLIHSGPSSSWSPTTSTHPPSSGSVLCCLSLPPQFSLYGLSFYLLGFSWTTQGRVKQVKNNHGLDEVLDKLTYEAGLVGS